MAKNGLKRVSRKYENKYKFGLTLSGGGARGIAHIGVIKALDEAGIEADFVTGTSAGSIVGALYSFGLRACDMIEIIKSVNAKDILRSYIRLPNPTDGIENIIRENIGDVLFDELDIPFTAVATDIITGKEVHLDSGNVAKACAASCSVPLIFKYVEIGDYRLQDGGLLNNIPADVVRKMGAEKVLSIDVNSTRGTGTTSTKLINIATASFGISTKQNSIRGIQNSDMVINVPLQNFSSFKLEGIDEMIELAYQETKKRIPEIKAMLGIKEKYSSFKEWLKAKIEKKRQEKTKKIEQAKADKEKNKPSEIANQDDNNEEFDDESLLNAE